MCAHAGVLDADALRGKVPPASIDHQRAALGHDIWRWRRRRGRDEARARPAKRDVVHARGRLADRGRDTRGAGYGNEANEAPAWASPAASCASRVRLPRITARAVGSEVIAVTARRGVVLRSTAAAARLPTMERLLESSPWANSDAVAVALIVRVQREAVCEVRVHHIRSTGIAPRGWRGRGRRW